jgi:eight-cysteine-cluster-containing protein
MARFMLVLLVGCAGKGTADPAKDEVAKDAVTDQAPEPEPAPEPPPVPTATPAALYAECEQRVEGPQKDAECTTDADCGTAGCGNEVCTSTAEKANVMTTCEDKLCFKILDACGCHEGECTWTLKSEVPASQIGPAGSLPSSLPPTEGGEPGKDEKGEKISPKDAAPNDAAPAPAPKDGEKAKSDGAEPPKP